MSRKSQVLSQAPVARSTSTAVMRDCDAYGFNYAQIFTHGPSSWAAVNLDRENLRGIQDIGLVVHSAYLTTAVWKITEETVNLPASRKALGFLKSQLQAAHEIGADGVVLHIGRVPQQRAAYVMGIIRPIAEECGQCVLLEMTASKADANTYDTPEKINALTSAIGPGNWWGWCVDTAHIWAAGQNIQHRDAMNAWFDGIEHWPSIKLFHLNGSSQVCHSGKDVHEVVFSAADKIWHGIAPNESGVAAVVERAVARGIPVILEINRGTDAEIRSAVEILGQLIGQEE